MRNKEREKKKRDEPESEAAKWLRWKLDFGGGGRGLKDVEGRMRENGNKCDDVDGAGVRKKKKGRTHTHSQLTQTPDTRSNSS